MSMNLDMDIQKLMSNDCESLVPCVTIFDKRLIELIEKYRDMIWDEKRIDIRPSQVVECALWKLFENELPDEFEGEEADEKPGPDSEPGKEATVEDGPKATPASVAASSMTGQVPGNVPMLERING